MQIFEKEEEDEESLSVKYYKEKEKEIKLALNSIAKVDGDISDLASDKSVDIVEVI